MRYRGRVRRVKLNGTAVVALDSFGGIEIEVPPKAIEVDQPLSRGHRVELSIVRGVGRRLRPVKAGRP
jgi:hypothetical protein